MLLLFGQLEEFEDTKLVIRICKSKKDRQCNGQKKKYKRTNNDQQNITQKTEDQVTGTTLKTEDQVTGTTLKTELKQYIVNLN